MNSSADWIMANSCANRLKFRIKRLNFPQQGSMFTKEVVMIDDEPDWPAPAKRAHFKHLTIS
jgi:hypothetical protein